MKRMDEFCAKLDEMKCHPTMDSEIYYSNGFIAIDAGTDTRNKVNVLVVDDNLLKGGE